MTPKTLLVLLSSVLSTYGAVVGPGIISTSGADSGERLNVDDTFTLSLGPGTYSVSDFSYFSTAASGGSVPFLSTLVSADTYDLLWIGSPLAGALNSTMSVNPAGFFTLSVPTTVYGGFYNTAGGRVAFASVGGQTVDHAGAISIPRGGVTTGSFSNANLGRTYSFSIQVEPTALKIAGPGFLSNANADDGERLNIDAAHPIALSAGQYNVDDFSFLSTAAVGTVTPFLARNVGGDNYETVWVGGDVSAVLGDMAVDPSGGFTLGAGETLYAGFYTASGGRVGYTEGVGRPPGFGISEHDNSFSAPTGAGQAVGGFSNPDLARTYSFSIGVAQVPEPGSVALLSMAGLLAAARRRSRAERA